MNQELSTLPRTIAAIALIGGLIGCQQSSLGVTEGGIGSLSNDSECITNNPDGINCKLVNGFTNIMTDSFERTDVLDSSNDFGWRKIINDYGNIISGAGGTNVDMQIYSAFEVGPASNGNRALYSFGRKGVSTHNLYMLTKTFDLQQYQGDFVSIEFDYLPINLEQDEYFRLEVCNDTADACGVGKDLTTDGLNSTKWISVFETSGSGASYDGRNHLASDYLTEKVVLFLEDFQQKEFIFRFHSRMNDGFKNNDHLQGMDDGVLLDNVRATVYDLLDGVREGVEEAQDVLDVDDSVLIRPEADF